MVWDNFKKKKNILIIIIYFNYCGCYKAQNRRYDVRLAFLPAYYLNLSQDKNVNNY